MTEPVREMKDTPPGWLLAPAKGFILLFIRDPKSAIALPSVITHFWYCKEQCIPIKLKNTRRLDYLSSYETWIELIGNGWKLCEHQFNACVDAA